MKSILLISWYWCLKFVICWLAYHTAGWSSAHSYCNFQWLPTIFFNDGQTNNLTTTKAAISGNCYFCIIVCWRLAKSFKSLAFFWLALHYVVVVLSGISAVTKLWLKCFGHVAVVNCCVLCPLYGKFAALQHKTQNNNRSGAWLNNNWFFKLCNACKCHTMFYALQINILSKRCPAVVAAICLAINTTKQRAWWHYVRSINKIETKIKARFFCSLFATISFETNFLHFHINIVWHWS